MMSSSRLQIILTGRPATVLAKSVVWNNSSPSVLRPKPPPRKAVWTVTLSGVVPAARAARIFMLLGD
jgi:hypothetical protein